MFKRIHVKILGDVIGVGYRGWVRREALGLGIKGWVRNAGVGCVEAVFEGEEKKINQMVEKCKVGIGTYVEKVDVNEENYKGEFESFEIVF